MEEGGREGGREGASERAREGGSGGREVHSYFFSFNIFLPSFFRDWLMSDVGRCSRSGCPTTRS